MGQKKNTTSLITNLGKYENQSIHAPGSIQPHGLLIALREAELEIAQVSGNTSNYLGIEPQELLGQPLTFLLEVEQVKAIENLLLKKDGSINHLDLSIETLKGQKNFQAIIHRSQGIVILELEPNRSQKETSFLTFYNLLKEGICSLQKTSNLEEFLHLAVCEVRKITGFDRVMIYKFDPTGSGEVVAEAKLEELSPYLGLHYPATDIPEAARELYKRCLLRYIPDINAQAVELVPVENLQTQKPLDLSLSVLRSVDRCCVEYYQNMGAAAMMVVAIVREQKLWGLISCHHQTPKYLSYEVRCACEFLAQFFASELRNKVNREELEYIVKLQSLQSEFLESISSADNLKDALIEPEPRLLDLVSAKGAAICLDSEIALVGETPTVEEIRSLIQWADSRVNNALFCTNKLPKLYPEAEEFKERASGLLMLRISQVQNYYILWFRPEVIQTVNWAGDPKESIKVRDDGSITLSPRTSFEKWQETVRLTSLPWKKCELENALALRNAIVGIVLNKADELAKINQDLKRSNRELDSFAYAASHDLKEPLRGIHNYATFLLEDYKNILDDAGKERLKTVVRLTQRMESLIEVLLKFSRIGQAELNLEDTDLNELLRQVTEIFRSSRQDINNIEIRIPRPLPTICCDRVLVGEVFINLISNAFKYNLQAHKCVEIGYLDREEQLAKGTIEPGEKAPLPLVFYVKDNGIGIRDRHFKTIFRLFKRLHPQKKYGGGTGAGLTIAQKIVERHGGKIWVESTYKKGSTFYLTLEENKLVAVVPTIA